MSSWILPGNRLVRLVGGRRGQYSARVNAQWRFCFVWREGEARYFGTSEEFWMNVQSDDAPRLERRALRATIAQIASLQTA